MNVFRERGSNHYFVGSSEDWYAICQWMRDNDIDYLQESYAATEDGRTIITFSVGKNIEWFSLKWP